MDRKRRNLRAKHLGAGRSGPSFDLFVCFTLCASINSKLQRKRKLNPESKLSNKEGWKKGEGSFAPLYLVTDWINVRSNRTAYHSMPAIAKLKTTLARIAPSASPSGTYGACEVNERVRTGENG
jgi:hypothetical protein